MSLVGMDEAVKKIEELFAKCQSEREEANAEKACKAFIEEFDTLVSLFLTPPDKRTHYQCALAEEINEMQKCSRDSGEEA
jgi:hypothetical protein